MGFFFLFFFPQVGGRLIFLCLCVPGQALEERLKQEQREEVHALKEAHRRTLDILRQQSEQELQTLRFELEDEGKAKLGKAENQLFEAGDVPALTGFCLFFSNPA